MNEKLENYNNNNDHLSIKDILFETTKLLHKIKVETILSD